MSETFAASGDLRHVTTFCGNCDCGCPELFLDDAAPAERRVVLTDDFGQRVQMSLAQLKVLVADVKDGALDKVVTAVV
ncbi:hypothetical protein [Amycolatopsis sp. NPDC004079]|uniref:hypothetical protein n=1 Tax=Amycolatopsis sp. NPDC004079 TaxID=3154549 RepID=UPI0033BDC5E8